MSFAPNFASANGLQQALAGPDLGVPLLEGANNYSAWSRDVQGVARHNNVWSLIDKSEDVLEKPTQQQDTQKGEQAYRYQLEDYKEQQGRVRLALSILTFSVAPAIRRQLFTFTTPFATFEYLKQQYKVSNYRAA